ncbi:serine hydrolase domain-containing protein [Psychrobacillus sp. FSL K6-1415]|jgi:CubicO group peptidase (beta-lactamase class C family)|uniref:serine hydrolase domain-containing protein n=1 Tax=Psychrobacillus sp. FSL K6-1415 TaxID=2921544 RepID=UPI0030FA1110
MSNLTNQLENIQTENQFSGSIFVKQGELVQVQSSFGYANRAETILNEKDTRFGIASGCKIFTAVAIVQLVEEGKLSFDTLLKDVLDISFPHFHEDVTVHHLLTHTSGIPDYFDEEVMDDFEELWIKTPMYHIRRLYDFLPLFQQEQQKFIPGEKFSYNNAGYIVLGLIVEKVSGMLFTEYVQQNILDKAGMKNSGYFALDALPARTAIGYIDFEDGKWKTNMYSLPIQGGSDGGAFVSAEDMVLFWEALIQGNLLKDKTILLTPHVQEEENSYYGYGVWIEKQEKEVYKYHVMGYDPGVSFHSAYYPSSDLVLAVCSNKSKGAYAMLLEVEKSC